LVWFQTAAPRNGDQGFVEAAYYSVANGMLTSAMKTAGRPAPSGQVILQAKFDAGDVGGYLSDIKEIIVGEQVVARSPRQGLRGAERQDERELACAHGLFAVIIFSAGVTRIRFSPTFEAFASPTGAASSWAGVAAREAYVTH